MKFHELLQHPRSVFPWHLDVRKSSVYMIHVMLFLIIVLSTKLRNKLLVYNINLTVLKKCMFPTVPGFPEDMTHCSVFVMEIQGFSKGLLPP